MTSQPGQTRTGSGPGMRGGRPAAGPRAAGLSIRLAPGAYLLCGLAVLAGAVALPAAAPGLPAAAYLAATAGLVLGVLASLIAHELAHALVARRYGAQVQQITIGLFGGRGHGGDDAATPGALWRVAAAGPAASLALAVVLPAAALGAAALGAGALTVLVLAIVAWVNAVFTVVSMLPGAGLDGGRIAHAWAWARVGDRARAAVTAARVGQYTGALLAAGGVALLALGYFGGVWAALAGLVMMGTSRAQARQAQAITTLAGLHVRDVLPQGAPVVAVPGWQTVQFLHSEFTDGRWAQGAWAFPVCDFEGRAAGLLTLSQLAAVPADRRATLRVSDVATPISDVVTTSPDEPMAALFGRLAIRPATPGALHTAGHALVLGDDGTAIGVLTPADFARARQLGAIYAGGPLT